MRVFFLKYTISYANVGNKVEISKCKVTTYFRKFYIFGRIKRKPCTAFYIHRSTAIYSSPMNVYSSCGVYIFIAR